MRGCFYSRAMLVVALLVLVLVPSAQSRAAEEGVRSESSDKLTTDIKSPDDVDVFTLEVLEGTTLNVVVKAAKKNGLLPTVKVYRPDGSRFDEAQFAKKTGTKNPGLKKLPIDSGLNGVWALRVGSTDGGTGEYTISFKLKVPKKVKAKGLPIGAGEKVRVNFGARDGSLVSVTVKEKDKKTGTPVATARLFDPFGNEIDDAVFLRKKTSLGLKKHLLSSGFGTYAVEVEGPPDGSNVIDVSVKVKFPKYKGRKDTLSPEAVLAGLSAQTIRQEDEKITVELKGSNLLTSSQARLDGEGLSIESFAVTGPDSATMVLTATDDAPYGERTLTFVPPVLLGEAQTLNAAIRVNAPDPVVTGASFAVVKQGDRGVVVDVHGEKFRPDGEVAISGDGITVTATEFVSRELVRATLDVDLFAAIGERDIAFNQPQVGGGAAATGPGLLTVLYPDPSVSGVSPAVIRQEDSGLVLTVSGEHFRAGGTITGGSGVTVEDVKLVSDRELEVTVSVTANAAYGGRTVTYTQPADGGAAFFDLSDGYLVHAPIPTVSSLSNSLIKQGQSGRKLTLTGTKFRTDGLVTFEGSGIEVTQTKVLSATKAEVTISADWGAAVGYRDVTFTQPVAGGAATGSEKDLLEVHYPDPVLSSITPPIIRQEEQGKLTLGGQHFRKGGAVSTNAEGVTLSNPTWISNTEFTIDFSVPADADYGVFDLTYRQPAGGGGAASTKRNGLTVLLPIPVVSKVDPEIVIQGTTKTIVITGEKFRPGGKLAISGTGLTLTGKTYVSTKEYRLRVAADLFADLGGRDVTYTQPQLGGGEAGTLSGGLKIHAPPPTLTKTSMTIFKQLQNNRRFTLTGTNFREGATVTFAGGGFDVKLIEWLSATQLRVTVDVAEDAAVGKRDLVYAQPVAGGGATARITDGVTVRYPDPALTSMSPGQIRQGDSGTFTLIGKHFREGGTVTITATGLNLTQATWATNEKFTVKYTLTDQAALGPVDVKYKQPTDGGGASKTLVDGLSIWTPVPTLTAVSPNVVVQGGSSVTLTLTGSGFRDTGTISVSGTGLTLTNQNYVSATSMKVTVKAAIDAKMGPQDVTYTQPQIGGGESATKAGTLAVHAPPPTVTSVTPAVLHQASNNVKFTVKGTNFRDGGTITIQGSGISVGTLNVNSATTIAVFLTATSSAAIGKRDLTYTQPAIGGGAFKKRNDAIEVIYPVPEITSVAPSGVRQEGSGKFVVTGKNFRSGGVLSTNASGLTLSNQKYVNSTTFEANYSVSPTASTGKKTVTFTQPSNGGGETGSLANAIEVFASIKLTSVSPSRWLPGASGVRAKIIGDGYTPGTTVSVGGSTVTDTSVESVTVMWITLNVASSTSIGTKNLTVTPATGNGPAKTFDDVVFVVPADPIVTAVNKTVLAQGASSIDVTVSGKNFRSGAKVTVSGSGVTVSSVSVVDSETISAKVSVTSGASVGLRDLTVVHSTADGAGAGKLVNAIQIVTATPTISAANPGLIGRTGTGGSTRQIPVTITGGNFMTGATVSLTKSGGSGVSVVSGSEQVVSSDRLVLTISVTGTATTGGWDATVTNPGGKSSSKSTGLITVVSETTLVVNRVLPGEGEAHGGDRVTVFGAGFTAGDVVDFGAVRAYGTQVIDRNTIVTTVPQPASTSRTGQTSVPVTVTSTTAATASLPDAFAYAKDEVSYFTITKEIPAQSATGVKRNLRSACIRLSAPIDSTSVSYGFTQSTQVSWGESGGYGVSGGIRGFGPQKRWLVLSRTSTGNLAIDNLGLYVLSIPTSVKSIGGVNFLVNRVASSTFDQRTFTVSSTSTDTTAPALSSITPSNGATNQVTTTGIKLVFSEELDPRTITTTNIALKQGTTTIGAAIWVDDDLKTVHLVPHTELQASKTYTVSIGLGLTDLCGVPFNPTSYTFTTNNGTDGTKPVVDQVVVEGVPGSLDGSGTYVNASGASGKTFDLYLPRDGFLLRIDYSDAGGAGIDTSKFSAKCSKAIGSTAANAELAGKFTVTHTSAEWRIPSSSLVGAGDNVTFTFAVSDLSGNKSTNKVITVDIIARTASTAGSGGGDLDPFAQTNVWVLRFDLDKYTHTYSTQSSPAKQGVKTTVSSNGVDDFTEALRIVGLTTNSMTSAAASTTNGNDLGTNRIMSRLVAERIREILRMRFDIDEDGTRDADSVDVEFLLPGEQGSLSSMPSYSTSAKSSSTKKFSELSFNGTKGAESNAFTAGTVNGAGYSDDRNTGEQANINTNGSAGIFLSTMLKREVNGYPTRSFYLEVSSKFVTIHGGKPVGEHGSDDNVLSGTFDRSTSTNTTHNARYDEIMDAIELVALYASATAAHEIGHSVGVVADGAPKTGQFGAAHHTNTFTDATSTSPNTSGHLSLVGVNNLMATGSSFSLMSRTGTEFQRFAPHVLGYLKRRIVYDEGK